MKGSSWFGLGKRRRQEAVPEEARVAPGAGKRLRTLRLENLHRPPKRERPLEGLSVLDLRCGDGTLCLEAVRQGARRVVGLEPEAALLRQAEARCPEASFRQGTWWELPDERFDVILLLTGLEAEAQPDLLLARLRHRLAPGGRLVLECSHAEDLSVRRWKAVPGAEGARRFPSLGLLLDVLLEGYAVRRAGPAPKAPGVPLPRSVFHCTPQASTALLIAAGGGSGKTTLARQFLNVGWPDVSTDRLFSRLLRDRELAAHPLAQRVRELVEDRGRPDWGRVAIAIAEEEALVEEFCHLLLLEAPVEARYFYIEGDVLRHPRVMEALVEGLKQRGVRPWVVAPG